MVKELLIFHKTSSLLEFGNMAIDKVLENLCKKMVLFYKEEFIKMINSITKQHNHI